MRNRRLMIPLGSIFMALVMMSCSLTFGTQPQPEAGQPQEQLPELPTVVVEPTFTPVPTAQLDLPPAPQAAQPTQAPANPQPPASSAQGQVQVNETHSAKGMYLTISGPQLPANYSVGPLATGGYAVGPNGRFLAYVSNSGGVYVLKFGNPHFKIVGNLRRGLAAYHQDSEPVYDLSFVNAEFALFLIVHETSFGQRFAVFLPRTLTY